MAVANTYDPSTPIPEQQAARDAAVVAEDSYYESAGTIERPLPDNWPWPEVAAMQGNSASIAGLEARIAALEEANAG